MNENFTRFDFTPSCHPVTDVVLNYWLCNFEIENRGSLVDLMIFMLVYEKIVTRGYLLHF